MELNENKLIICRQVAIDLLLNNTNLMVKLSRESTRFCFGGKAEPLCASNYIMYTLHHGDAFLRILENCHEHPNILVIDDYLLSADLYLPEV
jgi:hypothetical protein